MSRTLRQADDDGGYADPTKVDLYPLVFPYTCTFVPKGARYEWVAYLTGEGFAKIRELDAGGKERLLAFRVHFRGWFSGGRKVATFEILFFEGRLWWPLTDDIGATWYPGKHVTAADFVENLRKGRRDLFGLNPKGGLPLDLARTNQILTTAKIADSRCGAVDARLQRDLFETILLVGDEVYAVAGEPIFLQRDRKTIVASVYPDRALKRPRGVKWPPGQIGIVDAELERGMFQLADQTELAREATVRIKRPLEEMPTIEVLMPDLIRLSREDIRTDALFRSAVDDRCSWNSTDDPSGPVADALEGLKVAAVKPANATTTEDRFDALLTLTRAIQEDSGYLKDCEDFRYLVRHLKPLTQSMSLRRSNTLTAQDDEAISDLA